MSTSELILLFVLFFAGMLTGGTVNIQKLFIIVRTNKLIISDTYYVANFIASSIFTGLFGIVGGAIPSLFLVEQNYIVTISSGVLCSFTITLFSIEEIKNFLAKIIKRSMVLVFKKWLV